VNQVFTIAETPVLFPGAPFLLVIGSQRFARAAARLQKQTAFRGLPEQFAPLATLISDRRLQAPEMTVDVRSVRRQSVTLARDAVFRVKNPRRKREG
jgi:hypothetical protein